MRRHCVKCAKTLEETGSGSFSLLFLFQEKVVDTLLTEGCSPPFSPFSPPLFWIPAAPPVFDPPATAEVGEPPTAPLANADDDEAAPPLNEAEVPFPAAPLAVADDWAPVRDAPAVLLINK